MRSICHTARAAPCAIQYYIIIIYTPTQFTIYELFGAGLPMKQTIIITIV
jgi:hypothetical protein